jgi:anti-sigma B factor antagonist
VNSKSGSLIITRLVVFVAEEKITRDERRLTQIKSIQFNLPRCGGHIARREQLKAAHPTAPVSFHSVQACLCVPKDWDAEAATTPYPLAEQAQDAWLRCVSLRCFFPRIRTRMRAMPNEPFRVVQQASKHEGQSILLLKGAFTSASSGAFNEAVAATDSPRVIVDMTDVPLVDSMAVGSLVRAFVSCHKSGRKLALVGLNHRVHNVLHLTGVAPLFDTYATMAEAEASPSQ